MTKPTYSWDFPRVKTSIIEYSPNQNRAQLAGTIQSLTDKRTRINQRMRVLARKMRQDENMSLADLDEYQRLNDQLKGVKIWEAEMTYTRNML